MENAANQNGAETPTVEGEAPNPALVAGEVIAHMPRERGYDDREEKQASARLWLVSFTDLFSLMLCFFLMLYAARDPDLDKMAQMLGKAPRPAAHEGAGLAQKMGDQQERSINQVAYGEGLNLDYLQGVLKNALTQAGLQDQVRIALGRDHLRLMADRDDVFSGTALTQAGSAIAMGLGERFNLLPNRITLAVMPDSTGGWQEALMRASAFAESMRDGGYRKHLTVVGEGQDRGSGIEIRVEADDGRLQ